MTGVQKTSPRWNRFAEEVGSIVLGILLALAANAAYKYLGDRGSEREILRALRVEFAADVSELQSDQRSRRHKLESIDLLNAVRTGAVARPRPDSMASALLQLLGYRFYTASHPVLDDLLMTGRLDLIRSDALRHALMVFGQERSRIGVIEQRERDFVASQLEPYLSPRLDLQALASDSSGTGTATRRTVDRVLAEDTFGSLLYLNRMRTQNSLRFAEGLLATVMEVRRVLGESE